MNSQLLIQKIKDELGEEYTVRAALDVLQDSAALKALGCDDSDQDMIEGLREMFLKKNYITSDLLANWGLSLDDALDVLDLMEPRLSTLLNDIVASGTIDDDSSDKIYGHNGFWLSDGEIVVVVGNGDPISLSLCTLYGDEERREAGDLGIDVDSFATVE